MGRCVDAVMLDGGGEIQEGMRTGDASCPSRTNHAWPPCALQWHLDKCRTISERHWDMVSPCGGYSNLKRSLFTSLCWVTTGYRTSTHHWCDTSHVCCRSLIVIAITGQEAVRLPEKNVHQFGSFAGRPSTRFVLQQKPKVMTEVC